MPPKQVSHATAGEVAASPQLIAGTVAWRKERPASAEAGALPGLPVRADPG